MITDVLFKDKKPNIQSLLAYGFIPQQEGYRYSTHLLEGQFEVCVSLSAEGNLTAKLFDTAWGEEYVLHQVAGSSGSFIGQVKAEYEALLQDIAEKCFDRDIFKSDYAKMLIEYVRERYQSELEYLWERFPNNAIWRRKENGKWYGALLIIPKKKLGLDSAELVEIIDLRIQTESIDAVVDGKRYFPGYHMNKKHWFTICLDGSVPIEEIYKWIDLSYGLAAKK